MDATRKYKSALNEDCLIDWHAGFFPTGRLAGIKIEVARWRTSNEPMEIVSGAMGRKVVCYEGPKAKVVPQIMYEWIEYINNNNEHLFKTAAVAHLWFEVIHSFDDGNGRIGRALVDKLFCDADKSEVRFYSFSNAILLNKKLITLNLIRLVMVT